MTYPCSGCGLRHCDGRCFQGECYLESATETDPHEAEIVAAQSARAKAFWERWRAEQFTQCAGDPLLKRRA